MSRFAKLATGLRDLGNDINANISKALNISKASVDPYHVLLEEAKAGRVHELELLIFANPTQTINVNRALDANFLSPLCLACAGGHQDAAMFLLQKANADPNNVAGAAAAAADAAQGYPRDPNGDRSFCHGSVAGVTGPEIYGNTPPTPLMLAVEAGLEDVALDLLARGARVDTRRAGDGWTALHLGAARGHALIMRTLLVAPLADPGVRTAQLETSLTVACARGHLAIADMLLGEGSKGSTMGGKQLEPAAGAAGVPGKGTVSVPSNHAEGRNGQMGARGARCHAEERTWAGRTPLHQAAAGGHTELVLRLLAHGVSADVVDARGATPLILAARRGHSATAGALLKNGAVKLNASTMEGDTALHAAAGTAVHGSSAVVRLLLRADAVDVDARNAYGSTALHLAAASGAASSVTALLANGANPSAPNACGLTPGACFLRPPASLSSAGYGATSIIAMADQQVRERIRRMLKRNRRRHGHLRRLANASVKRVAVAGVAGRTSELVNRLMTFARKAQRWDLEAKEQRKRMQRLNEFREEILSDGESTAGGLAPSSKRTGSTNDDSLLLDLSPEREGTAARAIKRRRKAAAEALKGAQVALQDLRDWKREVLAERQAVMVFLRAMDPALAFTPGPSCLGEVSRKSGGKAGGGVSGAGSSSHVLDDIFERFEADVVASDPRLVDDEDEAGDNRGYVEAARIDRHGSSSSRNFPNESNSGGAASLTRADSSRDGGRFSDEEMRPSVGFLRAQEALQSCTGALEEARTAARSGDRLSAALETLRDHVKATLIDLMDLETSLPGDPEEDEDDDFDDDDDEDEGVGAMNTGAEASSGGSAEVVALTAEEAGTLDTKVGGLLRRLSGDARADEDGPPSLANLYGEGLGGAAAASETEVDATESLTARALVMVMKATAGPFLSALDDAYQRLTAAAAELTRCFPEAKALFGGKDSEEERAREARSRLVTVRQQVVDEEDHLEELVSKLRRRRRQAAGNGEISEIEDDCRHVRARLAALRSAKLAELKGLRSMGAYKRFPELLLEHPDAAESAFRVLLLSGLDVRDADEWDEHHMTSVASVGLGPGTASSPAHKGGRTLGYAFGIEQQQGIGGGGKVLDGWGGEGCRLAEVDGSAVAIVEVKCRDRVAKRDLVTALLLLTPRPRRNAHGAADSHQQFPPPELARITAISLREGRAMLEVPIEGSLSAKAWVTATTTPPSDTVAERALIVLPPPAVEAPSSSSPREEEGTTGAGVYQWEVWAVMLQALRGLASVHAFSEVATHRAVCLENILVASHRTVQLEALVSPLYAPQKQPLPVLPRGLRRAQLGPPSPAALAPPPPDSLAPETVRGKPYTQAADVYAFGIALRAACHGGKAVNGEEAANGGGGGGGAAVAVQGVLAQGLAAAVGSSSQSLAQVLGSMLEEDPSKRCTALEALSSDYFRLPPTRTPNPIYPLKWSPFPGERMRRGSMPPSHSGHPNWVSAAISAGGNRKGAGTMAGSRAQGWWESCCVVNIPPPEGDATAAAASEWEWASVESLLRSSLPAARLRRLVRLQDRGRWLRFSCARDQALAISADTAAGGAAGAMTSIDTAAAGTASAGRGSAGASVSCLFADPREVVTREALAAISAEAATAAATAAAANGKGGGRNGMAYQAADRQVEVGGSHSAGGADFPADTGRQVRCCASARFAAVALAPPPAIPLSATNGTADTAVMSIGEAYNMRTLAIVRAVTGVVSEGKSAEGTAVAGSVKVGMTAGLGVGSSGTQTSSSSSAGGLVTAAGEPGDDPFWGVEPSIDDLTRVGGIGLSSSLTVRPNDAGGGIFAGEETMPEGAVVLPAPAPGLGQPAVDSVKAWESLSGGGVGEEGKRDAATGGGVLPSEDDAAAVYTVPRNACYPEYLATFSFPPYSTF